MGSALRSALTHLRRLYATAWVVGLGRFSGTLARLTPSRRMTWKILRWAARSILRLNGHRIPVDIAGTVPPSSPGVFFANRAGPFDPLVVAASLPSSFLIADETALASLPASLSFLLKPLVVGPLNGEVAPPGGTLRQRVHRALEDGHSVVVFPDGPAGVPAPLSRFRLDAFHAAAALHCPIVPIGLRGTSRVLERFGALNSAPRSSRGRSSDGDDAARVSMGQPISPEMADQQELVELRKRVRDAIAALCR